MQNELISFVTVVAAMSMVAVFSSSCRTALETERAAVEEKSPVHVWAEENFEDDMFPPPSGPNVRATVRDGMLHVVDEGTASGELITIQRSWNAVPELGSAVEARVRVVSCEGMAGVMLGFSDGVHGDLLTLYTDRIELHHAGLSHAMDTTDGFNVYRVDIKDNDVVVSVNGEQVLDGAGAFTHPAHNGRNRISFGAGSSPATGEAYWDWVRWTDTRMPRTAYEMDVPDAEHITVFKQPDRYAVFPSLSIDRESGYLYTSFSAKTTATHHSVPGSRRVRMESRDQGFTWEEVDEFPPGAEDVLPGPQFRTPDGALARFGSYGWRWMPKERRPEFEGSYWITEGSTTRGPSPDHFAVLSGGYVERSEDGGATWERTEIPELDTYVSWSSPWSYAQLQDGTLIRAYMVLHEGEDEHRQVYAALTGDGKQVDMVHVMGGGPGKPSFFTEETLVHVTGGGDVWMITRVQDGQNGFWWQAVSEDNGRTWESRQMDIDPGRTPPSGPVVLEDGRMVLVYGHRVAPYGIRALVSEDEGLTWRKDRQLVLRDDGGGFDTGYPRAVLLPDGTVLTIYYYYTQDQIRHIACTRFTVPDLPQYYAR